MEKKQLAQLTNLFGEGLLVLLSAAVIYILTSRLRGAELLGQYSLVLAWTVIFQSVANFGLPEYLLREVGKAEGGAVQFVGNGLWIGSLSSLVAMGAMTAVIFMFGYEGELLRALLISVAVLPLAMIGMICRSVFLARRRTALVLTVALLESVTTFSLSGYFIVTGRSVVYLTYALISGKLVSCVASLLLLRRLRMMLFQALDRRTGREMLSPLSVFAMSNGMGLLSMRLNIIMLSKLADLSTLGLYVAAGKLLEVLSILPSIFGQFLMPRIARTFAVQGHYELRDYDQDLRFIFSIYLPLGLGVGLFADTIIHLLYGERFGGSGLVLRILMVYFLIDCAEVILAIVLKCAGLQKIDVQIYWSNLLSNAALSWLLIPSFGGLGAATGRSVGILCSFLLRWRYVRRHLARIHWWRILRQPLLGSLLLSALVYPWLNSSRSFLLMGVYAAGSVFLILSSMEWLKESFKRRFNGAGRKDSARNSG